MIVVTPLLAASGLALMVYAAMKTEPEDIARRAALGILGLLLLIFGVVML